MTIIGSIPLASTLPVKRAIFQVLHYVYITSDCSIATEVISKLHLAFFFLCVCVCFKALSYTPVEVKNADERTEKDISR